MNNEGISSERALHDSAVIERFLNVRDDASFNDLFKTFTPRLVAFFRARGCTSTAEDIAQEVMFTVYRKADQVRDRLLFRAWMFKIARHALSRQYSKQTRELATVDLADVPDRLAAINGDQARNAGV